jgi:hypothetical protein
MQELALSCVALHLTAATGVELAAFGQDGIAGAATSHGKGVPPEGRRRGGTQLLRGNFTTIALEGWRSNHPTSSVSRSDAAGNALAESTSKTCKKHYT